MDDKLVSQLAGQVLAGGFEGKTVPSEFADLVTSGRVGGAVLFSRNLENLQQARLLTEELSVLPVETPLLISIDHEVKSGPCPGRAFLGNVRNPVIGAHAKHAFIGVQFTQEHREQGGLSTAIGANQAKPVTGMRLEGHIFEQQFTPAA